MLVADDNEDAAELLSLVVARLGNDVRVARDGVAAVALAEEFLPHVVLMDIGMPRMDGYQAARRIRSQEWSRGMTLVAITGWGQARDKRRTQEAGFDHHLVKPTDRAALEAILRLARP